MKIASRKLGPISVLDVEGQITFDTGPQLRREFDEVLEQPSKGVLINLGGVTYLDSSGIAVLVESLKVSQSTGRGFALCQLSPAVRNVVSLVRLDKILHVFDAEGDAIEFLNAPAE